MFPHSLRPSLPGPVRPQGRWWPPLTTSKSTSVFPFSGFRGGSFPPDSGWGSPLSLQDPSPQFLWYGSSDCSLLLSGSYPLQQCCLPPPTPAFLLLFFPTPTNMVFGECYLWSPSACPCRLPGALSTPPSWLSCPGDCGSLPCSVFTHSHLHQYASQLLPGLYALASLSPQGFLLFCACPALCWNLLPAHCVFSCRFNNHTHLCPWSLHLGQRPLPWTTSICVETTASRPPWGLHRCPKLSVSQTVPDASGHPLTIPPPGFTSHVSLQKCQFPICSIIPSVFTSATPTLWLCTFLKGLRAPPPPHSYPPRAALHLFLHSWIVDVCALTPNPTPPLHPRT